MSRLLCVLTVPILLWVQAAAAQTSRTYPLPDGAAPVGLVIDAAGAVWFTSRSAGALGRLDAQTGETSLLSLGHGAQPSSLASGPDGFLFATDAVSNLVYQVDPTSREVVRFPIESPAGPLELSSATFDDRERLWFTAYSGYFGWLEPRTGRSVVLPAPGGRGPAAVASAGAEVWFASYTTDAAIRVDPDTLRTEVFALPSGHEGPKSLAIGEDGEIWVAAYHSRALLRLDPKTSEWSAWPLPGPDAKPFGLAFDAQGDLRVSDVGQSALLTFDRRMRTFTESVALGDGCMARSIMQAGSGIWVAETRCDSIRFLGPDGRGTDGSR
jgi:virginiamycin B lyase